MKINSSEGILDRQINVLRAISSDAGLSYIQGYLQIQEDPFYKEIKDDAKSAALFAKNYQNMIKRCLDGARTYWVAPEMKALVIHAAKSLPMDPLQMLDLPCPKGWVEFAEPIIFLENDLEVKIRAILWDMNGEVYHPTEKNWNPPLSVPYPGAWISYWLENPNDLSRYLMGHVTGWAYGIEWDSSIDPDRAFVIDEGFSGNMQRRITKT